MPRTPDVLIPQRPPNNTIELGSKTAAATYYLFAQASREISKATYDLLLERG